MVSNKKTEESEATFNLMQTWIDKNSRRDEIKPTKPFNNENAQTLTFENVRIDFPLRPYPAQVQMMKKIVHTLNASENALLESPTGSGKSLALLCAVLAWRENTEKKVAEELQAEYDKAAKVKPGTDKGTNIQYESKEVYTGTNKVAKELDLEINKGSALTELKKVPNVSIGPTKVLEDISVNITSQVEPIEIDSQLEITAKRPFDESDSLNWMKKYKRGSKVITINDDSFEDFQASGIKAELKSENKALQLPDMDKPSSMKYQTFNKVPRIFVGSRTHKQISQLISELKSKTRYNPRTTILGSRDQLCIHPKVSKASNKSEACVELLDKRGCHYKHKLHRLLGHPTLKDTNRVWDIEDLVTLGKKVTGCPYYASRKIYEGAEVVFCPYNYIIDPVIRKILDINLKGSIIILDEAHNIEDSSRSAGSYEVDEQQLEQVKKELDQIIRNGIESEAHQNLEVIVNYLYDWITSDDNKFTIQEYEAHHCHWTGVRILDKLEEGYITPFVFKERMKPAFAKAASHAEQVRKESENKTDVEPEFNESSSQAPFFYRRCLSNGSLTILQGIFMVLGFLFKEEKHYENDYQMVLTKKIERSKISLPVSGKRRKKGLSGYMDPGWSYRLAFKCLNPGIIFKDMTDTTRSVILTSGTLSPLNTFASELETKFEGRLEANHVIDKSHVWVGGISHGPNRVSLKGVYANWESFHFQDDLGEALADIVESVPYGVLCFVPSYSTVDKLIQRWKLTGMYDRLAAQKMIFAEPRGSDKADFESTIGAFYNQVDKVACEPDDEGRDGALFFAVFRGKVSEGIDFSDNYCRAVVTIGIPYPAVKDIEVKFKKEYNDNKRLRTHNPNILSSNQWYSAQAFRAINQALGRCIRHKNDWGAIILLEDRFQSSENVNQLSKWVRNQFKLHQNFSSAIMDLRGFVGRQLERTCAPIPEPISVGTIDKSEGLISCPTVVTPKAEHTATVNTSINNTLVVGTPILHKSLSNNLETIHVQECTINNTDTIMFDVDISSVFSEPNIAVPKITTTNAMPLDMLDDVIKYKDTPSSITPQPLLSGLPKITPEKTVSIVQQSPPLPSTNLTKIRPPKSKFTLSYPEDKSSAKELIVKKPATLVTSLPTTCFSNIPQQPSHHSQSYKVSSYPTKSSSTLHTSSSTLHTSSFHSSPSSKSSVIKGKSLQNHQSVFPSVSSPLEPTLKNTFETKDGAMTAADKTAIPKPILDKPRHSKDISSSEHFNLKDHNDTINQKRKSVYDPFSLDNQALFKIPKLPASLATPSFPPTPINMSLARNDFFSIANNDESRVQITCSCCDRFLLEGLTRNVYPVTIKDLTFITKNVNMDNSNMVELLEPGGWDCNVDLVGGPIDIRKWPNESSVILNREDGICYRSIHCMCPVSKSQGVVIRQSFGHRNSKYDGKVYLWLTQINVKKTDAKDYHSHINYQPDDSMEIGSSQLPTINDMFYDL